MRGTGIRFLPGTPCRFTGGSAPFNPNADPFTADGEKLAKDRTSQEWADRYCGGDRDLNFREATWGAEWMMFMGGLVLAFRGEIELPAGAFRERGDWDGVPTVREQTDAQYMVSAEWLGRVVFSMLPVEAGDGKTPATAMRVNRPSEPLKWFTEQHPRFGYPLFFENTAPAARGVSRGWPAGWGETPSTGPRTGEALRLIEEFRALLPARGGVPVRNLAVRVGKFLDDLKAILS